MKHNLCLTFLLLLFLAGCSESIEKPKKLIAEEKYINLMVEMQLVRTYGEYAEVDSISIDSLRKEILQKYGESEQTFVASHQYYQRFPQEQQKRIEKAIERLKMDQVGQDTTGTTSTNQ